MLGKWILSVLGLGLAGAASADWQLNMPTGVTELSAETYGLHMMVFWWCVAIGIVVFGVMIYSLFKHRKSVGAKPAKFTHSMTAEVIWTAIPVVILLLMALGALIFVPVTLATKPEKMDRLVRYYVMTRPLGWWGPVHRAAVERGLIEDEAALPVSGYRVSVEVSWTRNGRDQRIILDSLRVQKRPLSEGQG